MTYRAVILDMDGLMLDTERIGMQLFQQAAADAGFIVPDTLYIRTIGRAAAGTAAIYAEHLGTDFPFDALRQKRREYARAHAAQHGIPIKPGLENVLQWLDSNAIPHAIATSSARQDTMWKLQQAGLDQRFSIIVCGDEVPNAKPAPDLFLRAADQLGIAPSDCVVLEDSAPGIRAAHSAGMLSLLVPDLQSPPPEVIAMAHRVYTSLHETTTDLSVLFG